MNKAEFVAAVADEAQLSRQDAEKAVKAFTNVVADALKDGDKVQLIGFGTFEVSERKARVGRNPHTHEPMDIAATRTPKFTAGRTLRNALK